MHTISTELRFEAAHQLHQLPAWHKCSRVHGHNYVVTVELAAEKLDDYGFVVDFGEIKSGLGRWIDSHWDHRFLTPSRYRGTDERVDPESGVPDNMVPEVSTAEELARYLCEVVQAHSHVWQWAVLLETVTVWETPTSYATHRPVWLDWDVTQPEIPDETIEQVAEKVRANMTRARMEGQVRVDDQLVDGDALVRAWDGARPVEEDDVPERRGGPVLGVASVEVGVLRTDDAGDAYESFTAGTRRGPHPDRVEVDEPAFEIQGPPEPQGEAAEDAKVFRISPVELAVKKVKEMVEGDDLVELINSGHDIDAFEPVGDTPPVGTMDQLLDQVERQVAKARDVIAEYRAARDE